MANISYINNRIVSNTGSVSTSIGATAKVDPKIEFINSFSDINKYGFLKNGAISPDDIYKQDALVKNNILPPFEMELRYKEYYMDHISGKTKPTFSYQAVPFSPLNTEYFAKSMAFAYDIRPVELKTANSTVFTRNTTPTVNIDAKKTYGYDDKGRKSNYFDRVLSRYPNISPAILFASSLPIDTTQVLKLVYDDLKIPGIKQIPYTFALWLGSKWHYYKHSNEIFLGQDGWYKTTNSGFLDRHFNETVGPLMGNKGNLIPINLTDLSNYSQGLYVCRDDTVAICVDGADQVGVLFSKDADEEDKLNFDRKGKEYLYFMYGMNATHTVTFTLPTRNGVNELSNAVAAGVGVNSMLIHKTYNFLEDTEIDTAKLNVNKMISAGIIGNLKHYDFSKDHDNNVTELFTEKQYEYRAFRDLKVKIDSDATSLSKFDVIDKSYNGTSPYTFPLTYYPKFVNTRTVDINGIYSVTTPFLLDNSNLSKTYSLKNIFESSKTSKNTTAFYSALRNYILYNIKINVNGKPIDINKHIENIYGGLETKNEPFALYDAINATKIDLGRDERIELMLIILASFKDDLGGIDQIIYNVAQIILWDRTNDDFDTIKALVQKIYDTKIKDNVNINPEYRKMVRSIVHPKMRVTVTEDDNPKLYLSNTNISSPVLIYPKLLMDMLHGYIEITSESEIGFHPIVKKYYSQNNYTNDEIIFEMKAGSLSPNVKNFNNKEITIGSIDFGPPAQNTNTGGFFNIQRPASTNTVNKPSVIKDSDFVNVFGYRAIGYDTIHFLVLRIIEKILQEQINSRVSIDNKYASTNSYDSENTVCKLYPSAGGSINLGYGLNTHLYTDSAIPFNVKNRRAPELPDIRNVGYIKTRGGYTFDFSGQGDQTLQDNLKKRFLSRAATIVDPRVMRNHTINTIEKIDFRSKMFDTDSNGNITYNDTLMYGNLKNIRNSGLRYLWYSGPYFGAQTAQLPIENIIYSTENIIYNMGDISTVPRTNYAYKSSYKTTINNTLIKHFSTNQRSELIYNRDKYDYLTDFGYDKNKINNAVLRVGSLPNGENLARLLAFDTITKQLGTDMMNQFEGIFLDFCRPRQNTTSLIDFDEVMKLLMRVDFRDISGDLYYPSFTASNNAAPTLPGDGTLVVADAFVNTLSETEQKNILGLHPMEGDTDLINVIGNLLHPDKAHILTENNYGVRNTIAYLKNIVMTNAQYNKAKKVLGLLSSSKNDVYVKRNWVQNSSDNNLVLFYTQNATDLEKLKLNEVGSNSVLVGELYGKYITRLFDENYEPHDKLRISDLYSEGKRDLISKAFYGEHFGDAYSTNMHGFSYSYLENRAYAFVRNLIDFTFDETTKGIDISTTNSNIEFCLLNSIIQLDNNENINFFSNSNNLWKRTDGGVGDFGIYYAGTVIPAPTATIHTDIITRLREISPTFGNELLHNLRISPPDYQTVNSSLRKDIVTIYKIFLTQCFDRIFDKGMVSPFMDLLDVDSKAKKSPSVYIQTLLDEIEMLALNTYKNSSDKKMSVVEGTELKKQINNFLYSSYQNIKKYFDKHMSTLLYVIEQSVDSKNLENRGLDYNQRSIVSEKLKIKPYYNIKKIHDTWLFNKIGKNTENRGFYYLSYYNEPCQIIDGKLSFSNVSDAKLFGNYFHIVDRGNNDLSDELLLDPEWFVNYFLDKQNGKNGTDGTKVFLNASVLEASVYTFLGEMAKKHNSLFHALPSFNGLGLKGTAKGNTLGDEMFKTYNFLKPKESAGPHFIFQYIGETTSKLDMPNGNRRKINNNRNSFCFDNENDLPNELLKGNGGENEPSTTAFVVQFGEQNQQIFSNITLDQSEFSNTEEYFDVITNLTKNGNVKTTGNDLYKVYDSRSYTATITSMGNMEIEPLMYFYLKNVPLFKGSYWITNVSHSITANNIVTTFKGVRQPIATVKPKKDLFVQIRREYIKKLSDLANGETPGSTGGTGDTTVQDKPNKSVVTGKVTTSPGVKSDGTLDLDVKISKYFTLGDLSTKISYSPAKIVSQLGYSEAQIACNLTNLAINVIDKVKDKYPKVTITNAMRKYNGKKSQHFRGEAVDLQFLESGIANKDMIPIFEDIRKLLPAYDQMLFEHKKNIVIHISFSNTGKQRMKWGTMDPEGNVTDWVLKNYFIK